MIITLPDDFSQELFDIAVEAVQNAVHHSGKWEPKIEVINSSRTEIITLVECYIDMDDYYQQVVPRTWYNKSELDKRNIKYGVAYYVERNKNKVWQSGNIGM